MNVLAFDCSMSGCTAAVLADGRPLSRGEVPAAASNGRGQSEALMPLLARVMDEAKLDWEQLNLVAVTVGPGSFTGLRIGLAAARGFGLSLGARIAGVSTPAALAAGIPAAERGMRTILVAIVSKRAEPFVQAFGPDLEPLGPVAALALAAIGTLGLEAPLLLVGDAAQRLLPLLPGAILSNAPPRPDPVALAHLAVSLVERGHALPPEPLYVRAADVTLPTAAP